MSLFKKPKPAYSPESPASSPDSSLPSAAQVPRNQRSDSTRQVGYLKGRPGLCRNVWAHHPNRTTRKLRKLLVSWEMLGFFLGLAGSAPQVSSKTEKSFLKSKVDIAHSTSVLRSLGATGNLGREAYEMEREFIRILELCPSLSVTAKIPREARRELFYSWHSLYLFLNRLLGAFPYEIASRSVSFPLLFPEERAGVARELGPVAAESKTA
jgi:hypothetical protein